MSTIIQRQLSFPKPPKHIHSTSFHIELFKYCQSQQHPLPIERPLLLPQQQQTIIRRSIIHKHESFPPHPPKQPIQKHLQVFIFTSQSYNTQIVLKCYSQTYFSFCRIAVPINHDCSKLLKQSKQSHIKNTYIFLKAAFQ